MNLMERMMKNPERGRGNKIYYYPQDLFIQLGYDKVLDRIASECVGNPAAEDLKKWIPSTDLHWIKTNTQLTEEYLRLLQEKSFSPISYYEGLGDISTKVHIQNFVLGEDEIGMVKNILLCITNLKAIENDELEIRYKNVHEKLITIENAIVLQERIDKVLDEENNVRPDASVELRNIYKRMSSIQRELDNTFASAKSRYLQGGMLADTKESVRNGRRVLVVPAEYKRKVKGIIHDESGSGKTVFIEPEDVITLNNELFSFTRELSREIRKILLSLTADLFANWPQIEIWLEEVIFFDQLQAKAKFARIIKGNMPEIEDNQVLAFQELRHPLLQIKLNEGEESIIPNDFKLNSPNRILLLSGPNAGGKSVLLKAIGLNQLMLQTGILPACNANSKMGVFNSFFTDIGDHQSIEDDLSTYSSHLLHMKNTMIGADEKSLILIDEFGSGTDPEIGGAIAESVLQAIVEKNAYGVVATHYSNLKLFAYKTKGLVNGALTFDKDSIKPTYRLKIGKPGSSFAFEIAHKVGLPSDIIKRAKKKGRSTYGKVEELLVSLEREKQELEEKTKEIKLQQEQLNKIRSQFEKLQKELDLRRKKLKVEQKESILKIQAAENKRLEDLIKELKEKQKIEDARVAARKLKQEREKSIESVKELRKEIRTIDSSSIDKPLEVGDYVKLRSGDSFGEILKIQKNKVRVKMGVLTMEVHPDELVYVKNPIDVNPISSIRKIGVQEPHNVQTKLDIRGMRKSDAAELLQKYLDRALVSGLFEVQIIHGKGNGVLRKLVQEKVREYRGFTAVHPEHDAGGDGLTIVKMN